MYMEGEGVWLERLLSVPYSLTHPVHPEVSLGECQVLRQLLPMGVVLKTVVTLFTSTKCILLSHQIYFIVCKNLDQRTDFHELSRMREEHVNIWF